MAGQLSRGKLYPLFTLLGAFFADHAGIRARRGNPMAVGIAVAMFVALFGWGARYFGWDDPNGKIQLALATSFILGLIGGYKAKG
jgi:hypothetical protein